MFRKYKKATARSISKVQHKPRIWMYSPREKLHNCIWTFTIGDPDDNPSVPHAHAVEYGYRLNAWTGDIFPAGSEREKTIGHLSRKELHTLQADQKFICFAKRQIEWYKATYPNICFFVPDWFEAKCKRVSLCTNKQEKENDTFVFIGKAIIHNHSVF